MAQQPQLIFYSPNKGFADTLRDQLIFANAYRVQIVSDLSKVVTFNFDGVIIDEPNDDEALIQFVQNLLRQKHCPLFITGRVLPDHPLWQEAMFFMKPFPLKDFFKTLDHTIWTHRDKIYEIGPIRFEPGRCRLILADRQKDKEIELTDKETQLLAILWQHYQTIVPKEELLRTIWGYGPQIETKTLETHVYRLRKKLETLTSMSLYIRAEDSGFALVTDMPKDIAS